MSKIHDLGNAKAQQLLGLTEEQVEARTSSNKQNIILASLCFFCFFDCLGTVILAPAGPILCELADGGPMNSYSMLFMMPNTTDFESMGIRSDFIDLHESTDEAVKLQYFNEGTLTNYLWDNIGCPKAFLSVPFAYSVAMNVLTVSGSAGTGFGSLVWGGLSDSIGRKPCMLLCILGGLAGYIIMFLSGTKWNSYWGFVVGQLVNGLFSGSDLLCQTYVKDTFPKDKQQSAREAIEGIQFLGFGLGALLLFPFISGRAENLFTVTWVGIIGTIIAGFLLVAYVPKAIKSNEEEVPAEEEKYKTSSKDAKKESGPEVSAMIYKIMWIAVAGNMLDTMGDEGTKIARGTILTIVWPSTSGVNFQNALIMSMIVQFILSMIVIGIVQKKLGRSKTIMLGATLTVATQILFLFQWENQWTWISIWFFGKIFGNISSIGASYLIMDASPAHERGKWQGIAGASGEVAAVVATLCMAIIYDKNNDGSEDGKYGKVSIIMTIGVSLLALLAYSPLLSFVPKGFLEEDDKKSFKVSSLEEYLKMTDDEVKQLTLEEYSFYEEENAKVGGNPRLFRWGKYKDDIDIIPDMMDRSLQDFNFMRLATTKTLTMNSDQVQEELQAYKAMKKFVAETRSEEEDRGEMGAWIADYLDDAGYDQWQSFPQLFKVMLMNAFPPIDKLDMKKVDEDNLTMKGVQELNLAFLSVADSHIATIKKNRTSKIGSTLVKRK